MHILFRCIYSMCIFTILNLPSISICYCSICQFLIIRCMLLLAFCNNCLLIHYHHYDLQNHPKYPLLKSIFIWLFTCCPIHLEVFHTLCKLNNMAIMEVPYIPPKYPKLIRETLKSLEYRFIFYNFVKFFT